MNSYKDFLTREYGFIDETTMRDLASYMIDNNSRMKVPPPSDELHAVRRQRDEARRRVIQLEEAVKQLELKLQKKTLEYDELFEEAREC